MEYAEVVEDTPEIVSDLSKEEKETIFAKYTTYFPEFLFDMKPEASPLTAVL